MGVAEIQRAVASWDGTQPCSGTRHPLVDFDARAYQSQMQRFRELGAGRFRVSPDIVHMLVDGHPSAVMAGYALVCDPRLPPNTIVLAEDV